MNRERRPAPRVAVELGQDRAGQPDALLKPARDPHGVLPRHPVRHEQHFARPRRRTQRSEEHTSELQSRLHLVCRLLLEKKKKQLNTPTEPNKARPLERYHLVDRSVHQHARAAATRRTHRGSVETLEPERRASRLLIEIT